MKTDTSASPKQHGDNVRLQLFQEGYAVAMVSDRETYMAVCRELGEVAQTRDIFVKPDNVEKFTGYSYNPEEVPFHTDFPLINIVGLYCETPDQNGGENLLIDSRCVLNELTPPEIEYLKTVNVPLPRSNDTHPLLTMEPEQPPHIYWLPAFILPMLPGLDLPQAAAVTRLDQVLSRCRKDRNYISIRLASGAAVWFNNYVMLHGRDQLELSSMRHQVRVFITTPRD